MMSVTSESEATPSADAIATLEARAGGPGPGAPPPAGAIATREARVAELERELRMTRGVVDALPFAVFWKDTDLVYRGCNKAGRQAMGLRDDEPFVGCTDFELPWNREQAEAFVADDREVLAD